LHPKKKGKQCYIVWSNVELAIVIFIFTGAVQLTARAGRVKERILAWIQHEGCKYYDSSSPGELAKLDPYRYLLTETDTAHDPNTFPPPGALQLTAQDTPLVEVAELTGRSVYLLAPSEPASARYALATQQEIVLLGNHLAQMLVQLLTGQPAEDPREASSTHSTRTLYLPTHVKYSLSYWRKHTQLYGTWMTQHALAELAHLTVRTVQRVEQERRGPEHAQVYLSTVKIMLVALNEIREQQGVPLIQVCNIDWAPDEQNETAW
jgi:hypothetical protein